MFKVSILLVNTVHKKLKSDKVFELPGIEDYNPRNASSLPKCLPPTLSVEVCLIINHHLHFSTVMNLINVIFRESIQ